MTIGIYENIKIAFGVIRITRIVTFLLFMLLFILAGCGEVVPSPSPAGRDPTATATAMPPVTAPMATPTLTVAPIPIVESRWQCDPSGGLACFDDLIYVKMLGPDEGWAAGLQNVLLHYTTRPGDSGPTWQRVDPNVALPFDQLVMVSPTEGWAIGRLAGAPFLHYQDGKWEMTSSLGPSNDLDMVSPSEGWGVSNMGYISHYYNGEWHTVVPGGRGKEHLYTVVMVSPQEGWAAGNNNALFHYEGQQWQPVPRAGRSYFASCSKWRQ